MLEKELNEKKKQGEKEDSKHFLSKFTKGGGGGKKTKNQKVMISIPTLEDVSVLQMLLEGHEMTFEA